MNEDEMRAALIEYLRPAEPWPHAPSPEVIADALLPVVRKIAADELRAAADGIDQLPVAPSRLFDRLVDTAVLRDRADHLDPT